MTARNARQSVWLGGLFVLIGLTFASWLALPGWDLGIAVAAAVAIAIGIALFAKWRWARWLAALAVIVTGGDAMFDLVRAIATSDGPVAASQLVNAIATTLLDAWLAARCAWIVIDRSRGPLRATRRLAGAVLVIVAASNLALVSQWDPHAPAGLTFSFSALGIFVLGFIGWPIWHGLLLLVGLGLAVAPERAARHAAILLAVLVAYLIPMAFSSGFDVALMAGPLALPLYAACWLAAELGRDARAA
jgi:hypothetical protein